MKKLSKTNAKKQVDFFFENIEGKSSEQVRKTKKFAMSYQIPLKGNRKKFCKKCLMPYKNPKIRIRKGMKNVTCEGCGYVSKWKISSS